MPLSDFAFIVFGPDYSSESTAIIQSDSLKTRIVGVDSLERAESAALELVEDGVQLIELCGWFGPKGAARIIEAVGDRVPVGFVGHGPDSVETLYKLFVN
jgi:hypothetical protein